MKNLGISVLFIFALLLGGCTREEKESEVPVEDVKFDLELESEVEEETVQELEDLEEEDLDKDNSSFSTYTVDENSLHYQEGDKSKFESKVYLSLGDEVEVVENESVYAKVGLNDYKIIDSVDGNGRKALALFYTITNTSDDDIETTTFPLGSTPTFTPEIYFEDKQLKPLVTTTPLLKMDGEDYINNKHVQFTPEDAKVNPCTKPEFLKPGESRDCYAHYSYAGPGEYLIGIMQLNESAYHELQSYKLDISIEDEFTKNN